MTDHLTGREQPDSAALSHIGFVPQDRADAVSELLGGVPHRLRWLRASGRYLLSVGTLDPELRRQLGLLQVSLQPDRSLAPQRR